MNDDFEEEYDDEYDESDFLEDAKQTYDDIKDIKEKYDKYKNRGKEGNSSNPQQEAKNFDNQLRDKNMARSQNPQAAQQAGGEAAKKAGGEAAKEAGKQAATQAGSQAATTAGTTAAASGTAAGGAAAAGGTAAAAGTTAAAGGAAAAGTAAAAGGAVAAQAAIPVAGWIALAIEAAIALLIAAKKALKKHDEKMAESGIDSKGIRKLLKWSPILVPIALFILIIILLTQSETQEKVEFMQEAVKCFEGETVCVDFMNTKVTIVGTGDPIIRATDLELAGFIVNYVIAENRYYGSGGSSFMSDIVEDLNTVAKEGLTDGDTTWEKIEKVFKQLIDESIIGDTIYAWNLFKWIKVEKKVYNNIDWYKAYLETASGCATLTTINTWVKQGLLKQEPNIGFVSTKTRSAIAVDLNPLNSYLATPIDFTIDVDECIQATRPYIPSWIELYATYVATGDYGIVNDIYNYYVSDKYKLEVTLYQLTTVTSTEHKKGKEVTKYEIIYDGKTKEMTKAEYDAAIAAGKQGFFSWLGDKLKDLVEAVAALVDEVIAAIAEFLGFNVKVSTDYVPVVTCGNAFRYMIDQDYNIVTDVTTETKVNADSESRTATNSNIKYTVSSTTSETTTTPVEGEYEYKASSAGLYLQSISTNTYYKVRNSASEAINYYNKTTSGNGRREIYRVNSSGLYAKALDGTYFKVRNSSASIPTIYDYVQKTVETTTETTTETEKTATFKVTTTVQIDHIIKTWTNKLEYVATNITEYEEDNRFMQIFVDMVEENDYNYTIDDVAMAIEIIEAFYGEEYMSTGSSIDYSALPDGEFGWPVPANTVVSALFGYTSWYGSNHGGIDIWAVDNAGTPSASFGLTKKIDIVAAQKGKVVIAFNGGCADGNRVSQSCGGGYGNYVKIQHDNNYATIYGHLSPGTIAVSVGQEVTAGQYLGKMGSSGNSSGTHLHYEIQFDGTRLDPLAFYEVEPYNYKVPYASRNTSAITMANPYKVNFSI